MQFFTLTFLAHVCKLNISCIYNIIFRLSYFFPLFVSPLSRLGLPLLLDVECVWGLLALLFWLHRAVCSGHPAAAGLCCVCGDAGLPGRDVWGYAGPPTATTKLPQSLHQRHEVQHTVQSELITHCTHTGMKVPRTAQAHSPQTTCIVSLINLNVQLVQVIEILKN